MAQSDDGNEPAALAQNRRPGSRIHGSDQDIMALIVPTGGPQAPFELIGLHAPHLADLVRSIESPSGSYAKQPR